MAHEHDFVGEMASVYQPPEHVAKGAHVDSLAKYKDMYARSLKDPEVNEQGVGRVGDFAIPMTHGACAAAGLCRASGASSRASSIGTRSGTAAKTSTSRSLLPAAAFCLPAAAVV
jgi:hypothetical protein